MKIKLFTHTDLDGIGCAVVMKTAFDNVDVEYCNYDEINSKVKGFYYSEEALEYERIFITDISVNEEVATIIDEGILSYRTHLIDHHATALWLNKYNWAEVRVEESPLYPELEHREKVKSSGTSLVYKFLKDKHLPKIEYGNKYALKGFVDTVRAYDSWEWDTIYKSQLPKQLNDLLYLIGRENFLVRFLKDPYPSFTESETQLLAVEEYRINKYIWNKKKQVGEVEWLVNGDEYTVAYVYAEQYISQLGNVIAKEYGDTIDFVAIFDVANNKVSLRGIHDIDLSAIARQYGGGGHPRASGFSFNEGLITQLTLDILDKEEGFLL